MFGGPEVTDALEVLGLTNLSGISFQEGFSKERFQTKGHLSLKGEPKGIFAIEQKELTMEDLKVIPHDATAAIALNLDAYQTLDQIFDLIAQLDEFTAEEMREGLEEFKDEFGIDLQDDLLEPLGDTWCIYHSMKEAGVFGVTASIEADDIPRLRITQDSIIQIFEQLQEFDEDNFKVRNFQYRGYQCFYVLMEYTPIAPCWCLTDDRLLIGLNSAKYQSLSLQKR